MPLTLEYLQNAIETNFKTLHSPGDYGELLHISTKALNKSCLAVISRKKWVFRLRSFETK